VHTQYVRPGDPIRLPADYEYVVKPAVGAGARFAARYKPADRDEARAHVRRMHDDRVTAMVQPYLHQIDTSGERALVFVQGTFLHAIRKNAVLAPGLRYDQRREAHPGLQPWSPTPDELAVAGQALSAVPHSTDLLYARVDLASGVGGEPLVTELELVEPNLYLTVHPESIPTVARAIVRAATAARSSRPGPGRRQENVIT
jgi:glutathione synthase/RimK-type ligase-like ATP-grasp enzyme